LLGVACALVYLLAFTAPYWLPTYYLNIGDELYQFTARETWRGILFYVTLALLFGLYLAGYRLVAQDVRKQIGPWTVGLWTLLFCGLLIPVQPLTSSDVYGYLFQGRIVAVLGENPFVHLYREFARDPFYFLVTFRNLPATTGYGPLWVALEAVLGWLAQERLLLNLLLFKGLAAACHLGSAFLVYATMKGREADQGPGPVAAMLFYAWNPVLLFEQVGNAHNDAAVAALALLGFFLLSRDRGLWAIPCLMAAVLIKPVALLWLPLVAVWLLASRPDWPSRLWGIALMAVLALLPAALAYLPFWEGRSTFQGILAQSDIHGNTLPNLLIWGLAGVWPQARQQVVQGVKVGVALAFVPYYLWQLWRIWRAGPSSGVPTEQRQGWERLAAASFDVMLFYLLFVGFQFWPWYLTWLLVPAALLVGPTTDVRRTLALLFCLVAPLLYLPFGWQWARAYLPDWGLALLAALPVAAVCVGLGLAAVCRGGFTPRRVWRDSN